MAVFLEVTLLTEAATLLAAFGTPRFGTRAAFAVGFNLLFLIALLYALTAPASTLRTALGLLMLAIYLLHMDALLLFFSQRTAAPKLDARLSPVERWLLPFLMVNLVGFGYGLPFYFAFRNPAPLGLADAAAILVYLVGTFFHAGGDFQKLRFKARPENRGRLLTHGLWGLCRHPNYFGDFLIYLAFALLAQNPWAFVAPLLNFLQYRFDAIPKNEAWARERYGAAWDAYARRVKTFVPFLY